MVIHRYYSFDTLGIINIPQATQRAGSSMSKLTGNLIHADCYNNNSDPTLLLWSILRVIFKTHLFCLLSFVFVWLSLVFVHVLFSCFDLLFYLYLKLCLAREFTYCHIRNVTGGRVCGVRADLRYLVPISCGCA